MGVMSSLRTCAHYNDTELRSESGRGSLQVEKTSLFKKVNLLFLVVFLMAFVDDMAY